MAFPAGPDLPDNCFIANNFIFFSYESMVCAPDEASGVDINCSKSLSTSVGSPSATTCLNPKYNVPLVSISFILATFEASREKLNNALFEDVKVSEHSTVPSGKIFAP